MVNAETGVEIAAVGSPLESGDRAQVVINLAVAVETGETKETVAVHRQPLSRVSPSQMTSS